MVKQCILNLDLIVKTIVKRSELTITYYTISKEEFTQKYCNIKELEEDYKKIIDALPRSLTFDIQ